MCCQAGSQKVDLKNDATAFWPSRVTYWYSANVVFSGFWGDDSYRNIFDIVVLYIYIYIYKYSAIYKYIFGIREAKSLRKVGHPDGRHNGGTCLNCNTFGANSSRHRLYITCLRARRHTMKKLRLIKPFLFLAIFARDGRDFIIIRFRRIYEGAWRIYTPLVSYEL